MGEREGWRRSEAGKEWLDVVLCLVQGRKKGHRKDREGEESEEERVRE